MKLTELFLADLERELTGTRSALERVPEGHNDWKPHEKSMPLGYLANLVATMPGWIAMMINQDEMDMNPKDGKKYQPQQAATRAELLKAFEDSVVAGRKALQNT